MHGKTYQSDVEEALRQQIFIEKVAEIEQHNKRYEAGEESFNMAINRFSDMVSWHTSTMLKILLILMFLLQLSLT